MHVCMYVYYKQDLALYNIDWALNNQQKLICYKNQPSK